MTDNQGY